MKSSDQNTQWSDRDVDELLTTFFESEMPSALREGRTRLPALAVRSPMASAPTSVPGPDHRKWTGVVMTACAAALCLAVGLIRTGGSGPDENGHSAVITDQAEPDRDVIKVKAKGDDEFDIEVLDEDD